MSADTALLCMAYGTARDEADVERYYTHIRGGRPPSPDALADLVERYRAIGFSPLSDITAAQARAIGERVGLPAYVGMKHSPPFVADAVAAAIAAGARRLVGLPLAPHFAGMSVGGYERAIRAAGDVDLVFIPGFHDHPAFVAAVRGLLADARRDFDAELVLFTAHSLPARIAAEGDDYPGRLRQSAELVADGLDLPEWGIAFQSASTTGEPWFGPDVLEVLATTSARRVLVCPIGFVADHLEVLYDLDVEARAFAAERGIELRRTRSFNADPAFVAAMAAVVTDALSARASRASA
jgi:ferrochelatase